MKVLSEAPLNGYEHDQRVNGAEQSLYGFPYIFSERQAWKKKDTSNNVNQVLILLFAISRRFVRYDLIQFINVINVIKIRNQRLI